MKELKLRLTEDEFDRFAKILFDRGRMKRQAALLEAVRAWMKTPRSTSTKTEEKNNQARLFASLYNVDRKWIPYFQKLARIFKSRNRKAISAVTENITVFEEYIRLHHAQKKEEHPEEGGRPDED
ncbi:MAG: hypothetical protein LLG20_18590 [Acidobacteriales bacterium]|nr:hypothetical protein [Terriglobales bacterium]